MIDVERKILIEKQNGMISSVSSIATSNEAKVDAIDTSEKIDEVEIEATPRALSKKELKAAKKAEKKARKEALKEKKRNKKISKKDDLAVENSEVIAVEEKIKQRRN